MNGRVEYGIEMNNRDTRLSAAGTLPSTQVSDAPEGAEFQNYAQTVPPNNDDIELRALQFKARHIQMMALGILFSHPN